MEATMGKRIAELRKNRGYTQEELAEKLGVSAQAVSKWENDLSCPDVMLLAPLAKLLGVTTDMLLTGEAPPETRLVPEGKRKSINEMLLKIHVHSSDGENVRVNVPLSLVKVGINLVDGGMINVNGSNVMNQIDPAKLLELVEKGMVGKIIEIDGGDETVEIWVE